MSLRNDSKPAVKLCVEIDGPIHDEVRDAGRDAFWGQEGILTLRFTSQEVYEDIKPVLERIRQECVVRKTPSPTVPPSTPSSFHGEPSPEAR